MTTPDVERQMILAANAAINALWTSLSHPMPAAELLEVVCAIQNTNAQCVIDLAEYRKDLVFQLNKVYGAAGGRHGLNCEMVTAAADAANILHARIDGLDGEGQIRVMLTIGSLVVRERARG